MFFGIFPRNSQYKALTIEWDWHKRVLWDCKRPDKREDNLIKQQEELQKLIVISCDSIMQNASSTNVQVHIGCNTRYINFHDERKDEI